MQPNFAIRIPEQFAMTVGRLRTFPEIQIGQTDGAIWICGESRNDELEIVMKTLPDCESFQVLEDGQLVSEGNLVPQGHLPDLLWEPIRKSVVPKVPSAAFCGRLENLVEIELIQSHIERSANVLITSFEKFQNWAASSPEIRLRPLRFAVRNDEELQTLIHGSPLPPINGSLYSEESGIATLVGTAWRPALSAAQLAGLWELEEGDLCLWNHHGRSLIRADQFVVCTRSSLAATQRRIGGDRE